MWKLSYFYVIIIASFGTAINFEKSVLCNLNNDLILAHCVFPHLQILFVSTIKISCILASGQNLHFIRPDLGPSCLVKNCH